MRGDRLDRAHRSAYDGAAALMAPWAAEFPEPGWPAAWSAKTVHAGAISRFAGHRTVTSARPAGARRVLALWGAGGDSPRAELAAAQAATPGWEWRIADGGVGRNGVLDLLDWADVVVTHAGQNAVAEVADARKPAVVIADARPHGEQAATATAVHQGGLAIGLQRWPAAEEWPALLRAAGDIDGAGWARWAPAGAAECAAAFLTTLAAAARPGVAAS